MRAISSGGERFLDTYPGLNGVLTCGYAGQRGARARNLSALRGGPLPAPSTCIRPPVQLADPLVRRGVGLRGAVLERLPQRLDRVASELGELVEEEDAVGPQCWRMSLGPRSSGPSGEECSGERQGLGLKAGTKKSAFLKLMSSPWFGSKIVAEFHRKLVGSPMALAATVMLTRFD